jgi:tetratricopeptide (TPR) repeat protein
MKFFLHFNLLWVPILMSCNTSQNESAASGTSPALSSLISEIERMEEKSKGDSALSRPEALRLLNIYQDRYNINPSDSAAIAGLFEAARIADGLGKFEKAIELLGTYHDVSLNPEKRAESAFLVAFIYDAHLKDAKKATDYYNKVIQLYPASVWAEQAKDALHMVGKSDEELMEFLEQKSQQKPL